MWFPKCQKVKLKKLLIFNRNSFLILLILSFTLGCSKSSKIQEAFLYAEKQTQNHNNRNDFALHYLASININDSWWRLSNEAKSIANNLLSCQLANGAWDKGTDKINLQSKNPLSKSTGTFDNYSTTSEIEFLFKIYSQTRKKEYLESIEKGLDYIINSQYSSGAWPQNYPLTGGYSDYATFNDDVIANILNLLLDIEQSDLKLLIKESYASKINKAIENALDFIIKSQIRKNNVTKLGWAQQYDPITYEPKSARSFEPIAISSRETVRIIEALLKIKAPSPDVLTSINSAKEWLRTSAIKDYEWNQREGKLFEKKGSLLWARFYDLNTNQPIFCGRDSIIKPNVSEIEEERRKGYEWYGSWPLKLLEN